MKQKDLSQSDFLTLFGNRIRELREIHNLSRETLAEMAELSPQNIAKIESGERFVGADSLVRLSVALKVPPKELFEFVSDKKASGKNAHKRLEQLVKSLDEETVEMIRDVAVRILKEF